MSPDLRYNGPTYRQLPLRHLHNDYRSPPGRVRINIEHPFHSRGPGHGRPSFSINDIEQALFNC